LAKIAVSSDKLAEMEKDMASIVALMDTLKDADLPKSAGDVSTENAVNMVDLREDIVQPSIPVDVLVSQSPVDGEFSIPKVVDSEGGGGT